MENQHETSRTGSLDERFKEAFGMPDVNLSLMTGGASDRRYHRVKGPGCERFAVTSMVLVELPQPDPGFVEIRDFLDEKGIRVPRFFARSEDGCLLLVEDLGSQTLQELLQSGTEEDRMPLYRKAVQVLKQLLMLDPQSTPVSHLRFDEEKFRFEFEFHVREKLISEFFEAPLNAEEDKIFDEFVDAVSTELAALDPVFVHRDFQSSNLMVKNGSLVVIDFQDARLGPATYDISSLLYDSYVTLTEGQREEILNMFLEGTEFDPAAFRKTLVVTVIQRKLHDVGAFVYCRQRTGNRAFLEYIPPDLDTVMRLMAFEERFEPMSRLLRKIRTV